ncbi:uncharacterized protein C4orf50 homolog [Heterocephalus glaber]|uniref:Uncharacterized protein C4orf50 homolog n=1 Tax=Heterocephalus glaber TaxID=10181 RepID=A0AAX6T244_HETGA|nr:uncharacterized protein C4orf50 homolog [Heterocephalus glaber]
MAPALERMSEFPGDWAGPGCEQLSPAEHSLDGQLLVLVWGCPSGQFVEGSLLPADLARILESLLAAQERSVPVQASTLPPWGLARDAETLLLLPLREAPPERLQAQEELGTRPTAHPGGGCHPTRSHHASLHQESPWTSNHPSLRTGPGSLQGAWNRGGWTPVGTAEDGAARGTSDRAEGEHGDRWQLGQEGCKDLSPGSVIQAPEAEQGDTGAPDTLATACCLWPWQEHPVPLLQGVALEGPQSLSRSGRVEGSDWGFPEELSSGEEVVPLATGSRARGTGTSQLGDDQLTAGQGRAPQRTLQDKEDRKRYFGSALPLQEERARAGPEEEKAPPGDVSSLGRSRVPGQPGPQALAGQEKLFCTREHCQLQLPSPAVPAARCEAAGSPWGEGQDRCALQIDAFEREVEACFQQLHTLHLGSRGNRWKMSALAGENWSFASRWHSGGEECAYSQQDVTSQGWDACPAAEGEPKVGGEGVRLQENRASCTSGAVPGMVPSCNTASLGPAEPWPALERARDRFHQLLSALKEERRQAACDNATLPGDQDRCPRKACHLEKARARDAAEICRLEQVNRELAADLAHLQGKLSPCLQAISDLEACNRESYGKIMQLEEENEKLKGGRAQLQEAMSERKRKPQGETDGVTLGNRELKVLLSRLGARYKELLREVELAIEDTLQAFKRENEHLLRSVRGLEREVALRMSSNMGLLVCRGQRPQGNTTRTGDKVRTADKEVTGASGPLILRVGGAPLEEEVVVHGGQTGLSLDSQDSRCAATSPTWPSLEQSEGPSALQGSTEGAAGKETNLEKEEKRLGVLWAGDGSESPGSGPQCCRHSQDSEAKGAEEDPGLCVQQLHHQVQTLQCQLRDQGWANRELQAVRDQAAHEQSELRAKLEELQKEQWEARLAVSPLKAKLASLVQKCLQRNRLIMHLLQKLHRHGLASPLLSELAHSMVQDVALVEYAATFLTPGVSETSHLDLGSEDAATAAGRAQEYLPDSRMDTVLQSPQCPGSWPAPEAEWPAEAAHPASLKGLRAAGTPSCPRLGGDQGARAALGRRRQSCPSASALSMWRSHRAARESPGTSSTCRERRLSLSADPGKKTIERQTRPSGKCDTPPT